MPTEAEHRSKVESNQQFLAVIDYERFADWYETVAFYAALHLVDCLLARLDKHYTTHEDREKFLRMHFKANYAPYRALSTRAQLARYTPKFPVNADSKATCEQNLRLLTRSIETELQTMSAAAESIEAGKRRAAQGRRDST